MDIKLELTAQQIIDIEFKAYKAGYDPLAVDKLLDKIASDYFLMQDYIASTQKEIKELRTTNKVFKEKINSLEVQNEVYKEKLGNISEDDSVSYGNLDLIKRINSLENALHKAGVDPTLIK